MEPCKVKTILFSECVLCWVEILVVLTIDGTFLKIIADETYKVWQEFFEEIVGCMIFIDQKEELIAFLSLHLAAHVILLLVSMAMLMGIFMVKPASVIFTLPFIVAIGITSFIDLMSAIYFAVEISRVHQECSKSLFLPLYFCKGILLWIVNLIIAVHVHTLRNQLQTVESEQNMDISRNRPGTIYSLPWQSYPTQITTTELDTSEIEHSNNSLTNSYQTQTSVLTFRRSVSSNFSNEQRSRSDQYDDILEAEYQYWDTYKNIKS